MLYTLDDLQKIQSSEKLQDLEWSICFSDPYHWLINWAQTLDSHDEGSQTTKTFPDKKYLEVLVNLWLTEKLLLVPKSRQMMVSWLFTALYLWDTMFHEGRLIFFQSKKADDADDLVKRAKFIWDHLPKFLKRYYRSGKFLELSCNPQARGQHVYCKMVFPDINSEIRGIPEGGDVIRMHTASGILCIAPETKILTSDLRWVEANLLKEGDIVAGFDENTGQGGFKSNGVGVARQWRNSVIEKKERFIKPCYQLIFSDGTKIVCTAEHPWLAGYGQKYIWLKTKDLKVKKGNGFGSKIVKFIDIWKNEYDYETGWLAGIYDGEGSLYQKSFNNQDGIGSNLMLTVSQNEGKILEQIKSFLIKKNFSFNIRHIKDDRYTKQHYQFEIGKRQEIMRFLGQIRPIRLLEKKNLDKWGTALAKEGVELIERKFIGNREVIGLKTSTKTFVAEGLASHNSDEMAFQPEAESSYTAAKPTLSSKGRFTGLSTAEDNTYFQKLVFDLKEEYV